MGSSVCSTNTQSLEVGDEIGHLLFGGQLMHVQRQLVEHLLGWKSVTLLLDDAIHDVLIRAHDRIQLLLGEQARVHCVAIRFQIHHPYLLLLIYVHVHLDYQSIVRLTLTLLHREPILHSAAYEITQERANGLLLRDEKWIEDACISLGHCLQHTLPDV